MHAAKETAAAMSPSTPEECDSALSAPSPRTGECDVTLGIAVRLKVSLVVEVVASFIVVVVMPCFVDVRSVLPKSFNNDWLDINRLVVDTIASIDVVNTGAAI